MPLLESLRIDDATAFSEPRLKEPFKGFTPQLRTVEIHGGRLPSHSGTPILQNLRELAIATVAFEVFPCTEFQRVCRQNPDLNRLSLRDVRLDPSVDPQAVLSILSESESIHFDALNFLSIEDIPPSTIASLIGLFVLPALRDLTIRPQSYSFDPVIRQLCTSSDMGFMQLASLQSLVLGYISCEDALFLQLLYSLPELTSFEMGVTALNNRLIKRLSDDRISQETDGEKRDLPLPKLEALTLRGSIPLDDILGDTLAYRTRHGSRLKVLRVYTKAVSGPESLSEECAETVELVESLNRPPYIDYDDFDGDDYPNYFDESDSDEEGYGYDFDLELPYDPEEEGLEFGGDFGGDAGSDEFEDDGEHDNYVHY